MTAFAKVDASGMVIDVIELDGFDQSSGNSYLSSITSHPTWVMGTDLTGRPGVGLRWTGIVFGVKIPDAVTNFQIRAALHDLPGKNNPGQTLFDEIDVAMIKMGGTSRQAWEYANIVTRTGALVKQVALGFGVSDEELDNIFISASGLEA